MFLSISPHPKREQMGYRLGGGEVCWLRVKPEVAFGDIMHCPPPKLLWMRGRGSLGQVQLGLLASLSLAGARPTDFIATIICDT